MQAAKTLQVEPAPILLLKTIEHSFRFSYIQLPIPAISLDY